jgi:hypothetical protein
LSPTTSATPYADTGSFVQVSSARPRATLIAATPKWKSCGGGGAAMAGIDGRRAEHTADDYFPGFAVLDLLEG